MLIFALLVILLYLHRLAGDVNMWFAVLIIGLAAAAHQAWSANIFTTVSDMFPKSATASVTGIGGMFGGIRRYSSYSFCSKKHVCILSLHW